MSKEPIWNRYLTDEDKTVIEAAGWTGMMGFGKRPAILVIDVSYGWAGQRDMPILEAMKRWRLACGPQSWDAIDQIARLTQAGRSKGLPVIYTTGFGRADAWDAGGWGWKNTKERRAEPVPQDGKGHSVIVEEIAPQPQDIVIYKQKPSAFFGTNLQSYLTLLQCDSLIVTGTVTSGCVRASVIDAFSLNYRVAVAGDACFDRIPASHALNLLDMHSKYADVRDTADIVSFFETLPDGLFDLPKGSDPSQVSKTFQPQSVSPATQVA